MIMERVTNMLQHLSLKLEFQAEVVQTTMYLINLWPLKAIKLQVPQALCSDTQPNYNQLRIFGCEAYAFIPREKRTKLSPHATKCIFLGYRTDGKFGYKLWDLENRKLI